MNRTFKVIGRYDGIQKKKRVYTSFEDYLKYKDDLIARNLRIGYNVECYELINGEWKLIEETITDKKVWWK